VIDWLYSTVATQSAFAITWLLRKAHNGNVNRYVLWSIFGAIGVVLAALAIFGGVR